MIPFSIHCTTCHAALRVTRPEAIGQILPCPKCASMVFVDAPAAEPAQAPIVGAGLATTAVVTTQAEMSSNVVAAPAIPAASDIEQLAAAGAAMIPDYTPGAVRPPPTPDPASAPPPLATAESSAGLVWLTGVAAAAICLATVAWGVWWRLGTETETASIAQSGAAAVSNTGATNTTSSDPATNDTAAVPSDADQAAAAKEIVDPPSQHTPEAATEPAHDSDPDETRAASPGNRPALEQPSNPPYETAATSAVTAVADKPATASDDEPPPSSAVESNPLAPPAAAANDSRVARKPALEMHDLPVLPDQLTDPAEAPSIGAAAVPPPNAAETDSVPAAAADENPVNKLPELRRIAPKEVDLPACLAAKLVAVQFEGAPLHEAIAQISQLCGVTISLDADAARAVGIDVHRPVILTAHSTTVGDVLKQMLTPLGLEAREVHAQLLVTAPGASSPRRARYAVDDLVRSGDPPIETLAALVQSVLNGADQADDAAGHDAGAADIRVIDGALHLTASEVHHDRMIELCEKLRVARGRPLRSRYSANLPDPRFHPARFELGSRRSKAKSILDRKVSAGIGRPTPLDEVVAYLSKQTNTTMLIDGPALAAAGLSIETEAALVVVEQPLEVALVQLLEPIGLVHRVVAHDVIEITSPESAARRLDLEFYPVRDFAPDRVPSAAEIESYRDRLLAAAGLENAAAKVFFDSPGQSLIVLASYPAQMRLQQAIANVQRGGQNHELGRLNLRSTIDAAASRR